jgi:hypothetical protein
VRAPLLAPALKDEPLGADGSLVDVVDAGMDLGVGFLTTNTIDARRSRSQRQRRHG